LLATEQPHTLETLACVADAEPLAALALLADIDFRMIETAEPRAQACRVEVQQKTGGKTR